MPLHTCFDTCQVFTISKFHLSHRCARTVIVMADADQDFPKARGSFYVQVLLSSPAFWSQIWFASAKYTLISLPTCAKPQRMWQIESAISLSRPGALFEWDVKINATLPALEPQNRNVIGKIDHLQLAFLDLFSLLQTALTNTWCCVFPGSSLKLPEPHTFRGKPCTSR